MKEPPSRFALVNGRVVLPQAVEPGKAVLVDGATLAAVCDPDDLGSEVERIDVGGRLVTPGLIDIHTHGAGNHDWAEATPEAFAAIAGENLRRGVTSLLATVSTAPLEEMLAALEFCRQWMSEPRPGSRVRGVHLEGPYFSLEQKGAQDPRYIRQPDDGSADALLAYREIVTMMTFAPELPGALELTRRLDGLGIVPAAGHSDARDVDVRAAMDVGLRHTVHAWSGQSSTIRIGAWRKPGLLEATLAFDRLTAEIIADNRHLPPPLMQIAYKCKGPDRLCAVSDATGGAGLPEGTRFGCAEMSYVVGDGVALTLDGTSFAGSTTLLNRMLPILTDVVGIPLAEAVRMVSLTPARVIGLDRRTGSLEAGKEADIAILDEGWASWGTLVGGRWAWGPRLLRPGVVSRLPGERKGA